MSNALKELKKLTQLNLFLGHNKIGAEGAQHISNALKELKQLTQLNLDLW